jgi:hypothetical protein
MSNKQTTSVLKTAQVLNETDSAEQASSLDESTVTSESRGETKTPESVTQTQRSNWLLRLFKRETPVLSEKDRQLLKEDDEQKTISDWKKHCKLLRERMELIETEIIKKNVLICQCLNLKSKPVKPIPTKAFAIRRLRAELSVSQHEHRYFLHEYNDTMMAITNYRILKISNVSAEDTKKKAEVSQKALDIMKDKVNTSSSAKLMENASRMAEYSEELRDAEVEFQQSQRHDDFENDDDFYASVIECTEAATFANGFDLSHMTSVEFKQESEALSAKVQQQPKRPNSARSGPASANVEIDADVAVMSARLNQVPPAASLPVPNPHYSRSSNSSRNGANDSPGMPKSKKQQDVRDPTRAIQFERAQAGLNRNQRAWAKD